MATFNTIIYAIPFLMLLLVFFLAYIDFRKKRTLKSHPLISFIIPFLFAKENSAGESFINNFHPGQ